MGLTLPLKRILLPVNTLVLIVLKVALNSGGLAILWKKNLNFEMKIICTHYNFIVASLMTMGKCIAIVNIYMPHDDDSRDVLTEYDQVLGEFHTSLDSADTDNIICFGDFNAEPNRGRFWGRVSEFCASYNFRLVDSINSTV